MYGLSNTTPVSTITPSSSRGLALCALAVLGFSFTLPATRIAAGQLDPWLFGLGRGAIAGFVALALLASRSSPRWQRHQLGSLAIIAAGVVLGFPLLTALALETVPAHHGVIVIGLSPLLTSVIAALRARERLAPAFWLFAVLGALAVVAFGAGRQLALTLPDLWLLSAVIVVSLAYAEGARLARELDGLLVICRATALALPITFGASLWLIARDGLPTPSGAALGSLAYVSLVSSLLAFAAWYRGLSLGGIARGSQVQLLQPLLSLLWCALLLGEALSASAYVTGGLVLASAAGTRWASRPRPAARELALSGAR